MSIKQINRAFKRDVSPSEKLILLCLADHANEEGVTVVSRSRIAEITGCGLPEVDRVLQALVDRRLLAVITPAREQFQVL